MLQSRDPKGDGLAMGCWPHLGFAKNTVGLVGWVGSFRCPCIYGRHRVLRAGDDRVRCAGRLSNLFDLFVALDFAVADMHDAMGVQRDVVFMGN